MKDPHIFSDNPMDRGERERRNEPWIKEQSENSQTQFLIMSNLNVLLTTDPNPSLAWVSQDLAQQLSKVPDPIFLGILDGKTRFVLDVPNYEETSSFIKREGQFQFEECRAAGGVVCGPEAGIIAQARAQVDWHKRNQYCSVCGGKSIKKRGGQVRQCSECNAQQFPRTDPVVIMVVADSQNDRCLLGQSRGRLSRMNMYSALAGFMDQGETIEEAVAREVMEEAGIEVKNVKYHSSQPWPFPSSLMIGCIAEADSTNIEIDNEEMTDVQWFNRDEVLLALRGESKKLTVPGKIAIAHHLINAWANREQF